jgi:hypothetical protein
MVLYKKAILAIVLDVLGLIVYRNITKVVWYIVFAKVMLFIVSYSENMLNYTIWNV